MKKNFWKTIIESCNPFKYEELSKRGVKESLKYFILFFTLFSAISLLLSIASIISFPNAIREELSKAEEFSIQITYNSTEPLHFPPDKPFLSIVNNLSDSKANFVIYDDELIYQPVRFVSRNVSLSDYSDISESSREFSIIIGIILFLMLPSLLIYTYIFYLVKYMLIIFAFSFIAKFVAKIAGKKIKYKRLFTASVFSITPLIAVEMILMPFKLSLFYVPLILYVIWYIVIAMDLIEEF
ncbi:MAG: DUF1189 family protein [Candidatus Woesearchaeota archaeon]